MLHVIGNILDALQRGRNSLLVPKKKPIEELIKGRNMKSLVPNLPEDLAVSFYLQSHKLIIAVYQLLNNQGTMQFDSRQAEIGVQWLNDVLLLLMNGQKLCQQLKDKVSPWTPHIRLIRCWGKTCLIGPVLSVLAKINFVFWQCAQIIMQFLTVTQVITSRYIHDIYNIYLYSFCRNRFMINELFLIILRFRFLQISVFSVYKDFTVGSRSPSALSYWVKTEGKYKYICICMCMCIGICMLHRRHTENNNNNSW